jgi:multidrug efflux pump subunit AcrA (membrane-fusion protein)
LSGTVSAIHQGTVAAQTSGRVSRMLVDVNDEVQAGQPLLEISGKEQSAAVTGAEARVARAQAQQVEAERQLSRYQALIAKG